ncbi:MAG: energy transducer TonB [Phycisphaeraceae bacterium]|nr:energy transducer TonB [Phycisphaeraceae bacterium]
MIAKAVKPGAVVAQEGLRINTAKIRLTITTRYTTSPANPQVELIFNPKGRVLRARILRSTGYPTVDGPVLSSLYKWTAEGKPLSKAPTTRVTVTIEFR